MSPDEEIMSFAASQAFIVLTRDMDFSAILAATGNLAPSVVQLRRQDRFDAGLVAKVAAAMRQVEHELQRGAVLTIQGTRIRLRRLPIGRKEFDE